MYSSQERLDCATVTKKIPDLLELTPPKFISQMAQSPLGGGGAEQLTLQGNRLHMMTQGRHDPRLMEAFPSCAAVP